MLLTQPNKFTVSNRTIKNNHLFLVDTTYGDITPENDSGLGFYNLDTRFLNCFEILLNGLSPVCLLSSTEAGYLSTLVYTNGQMESRNADQQQCTVLEETIQLKRESILDGALFEKFTLSSYNMEPVELQVSIQFGADFRDIFEIRHLVPFMDRKLDEPCVEGDTLIFAYRTAGKVLETRIRFKDFTPKFLDKARISFETLLYPLEKKEFNIEIQTLIQPAQHVFAVAKSFDDALSRTAAFNQAWRESVTQFSSDNDDFNEMVDRSQKDLRMLLTQAEDGTHFVAAGIPWYVCLFGRDSLITARECLIFNPSLAKWTLNILAKYQGTENVPYRDEEPGKILHELRTGELAQLGKIPHTPYFGSVDATPLWIMLLYDYFTWTRDCQTLNALWPNALAAMDWIDNNLKKNEQGYSTYQTQSQPGLGIVHQGWKDSCNSAMYENGIQAEPPIALSEVQGYVYLAKRRMGSLAEFLGDKALKAKLKQEASDFKHRFNRDFWLDDLGFCALGLDNRGRHLRVVASNPGHCLETGIFSAPHAKQVASRLMAPDMFNGWGIRTLSKETVAYNPMSYHNGSIWPHDNAVIAKGLSYVDRLDYSERVFSGMFEAARVIMYKRLPELFCGFSKDDGKFDPPVKYPVACSPQAWASASVFSFIQSLLNLTPDLQNNTLKIKQPRLPHWMNVLYVRNLRVGTAILDLDFKRTDKTVVVDVQNRQGKMDIILTI